MEDLVNSLEDVVQMCSQANQEGASGMDKASGEQLATQAQGANAEAEDEIADDEEDDQELDKKLLIDSVQDPINRLFKISTKIRNPSTRLGSSRAANCQQVDEETGVDLLQAMKKFDLDYVESMFLQYRKTKARRESPSAHPPEGPQSEKDDGVWEPIRTVLIQEKERKINGADSYLIERIAQANFRRRQQFAYWAQHRAKLDKHTKAFRLQKGRLPTAERHHGGGLGMEIPRSRTAPSVTTATRLDIAQLEISSQPRSDWSFSEYAPSTRQGADASVNFPPAPKVRGTAQKDKFFECPYCFFLCPTDMRAEKAWKAHLIHDLRPYICTYEDCRTPTQLYDSRKDWVQHENSEHRKVWRCLEHSNKVYESLDAYERHLQERHGGSNTSEASLARITQASESVTDVGKRTCPICAVKLDTGRAMDGHIALHLERFARFSLPRSVENDDDSSNADSDKANRVDEEGSRDEDFEAGSELHSDAHASETQSTEHPSEVGSPGPPRETGTTGDTVEDLELEASEDGDESSSSESGGSHREFEQPTGHGTTFDGLKVGEWCTDLEKFEKVERQFWEALEQTEKKLGSDHPDTLDRMESLVDLLEGQLKFKEAEQVSRRRLEQREKALGREHPEVWTCLNLVGHLLFRQERYGEAEQIHREVLGLREKKLGREHIDTILSLSNLAITLSNLGRFEEAEKLGREVMESHKKVLGPSHADTLLSTANLADVLERLGQLEEAERLRAEAMEIQKQELGPDHPETLISIARMATVLWRQGRFDEAEKLEVEALEASRQKLGSTHPDTVMKMHNLADTWHSQGRLGEATDLMDECVQLRRQVLGPEHELTLDAAKALEEWRAELEQVNS